MKWLKSLGLVIAFGCMGVAGWQVNEWRNEQRLLPGSQQGRQVGTGRPAVPATAAAAPGTPLPPAKRPPSFVLATVWRQALPTLSDADWRRAYPAFGHEPFDKSGFSAVPIPWRFGATDDAGPADPDVARAVPFLLSFDLAWSPESFGTRNGHFVFQRSGGRLAKVEAAYDPRDVATLVRAWNGTHAVGGVLVRGKDGYVATLQIFDRDGTAVHEAAFEKPQDFFAVMGDVSCEALRFLGTPPNAALAEHLHRRRCELPGSLATLGRAASEAEGSRAEAALYDEILAADPKFAEVRAWRADRRRADGDASRADRSAELATSLADGLTVPALTDFAPTAVVASDEAARLSGWVDRAESLAGRDHPAVVARRLAQVGVLRADRWRVAMTTEELRPFLAAAGRHPNHLGLLTALADAHREPPSRGGALVPPDPEMEASLALAAVSGRGLPSFGHGDDWFRVMRAAHDLRRPDHVLAAAERWRDEPGTHYGSIEGERWIAEAYMDLGQFQVAADRYLAIARRTAGSSWDRDCVETAAACLALTGRATPLDALATDPSAGSAGDFIARCQKFLAGEPIGPSTINPRSTRKGAELLIAEAELAQGGDFNRTDRARIWEHLALNDGMGENGRARWIVLERFYRQQPTLRHAPGFYEAAEWEHPEDPYVTATVAAWRKAGGDATLPSADEVVATLTKSPQLYSERPAQWLAVARIRRDLEAGRPDDAKRVLAAFRKFVPESVRAAWLARKIEEVAPPTGQLPPSSRPTL